MRPGLRQGASGKRNVLFDDPAPFASRPLPFGLSGLGFAFLKQKLEHFMVD